MKNSINYSIIIPHHNCPVLLQRLISSIPARADIQIIVVDDASDPEIVNWNTFKFDTHKNIELYIIPKSQSKWAGHARNVGLEHAKGKWLLFADSDDFYEEGAFKLLDRYLESSYDVIYFNCDSVDSDTLLPCNRIDYIKRLIKDRDIDSIKYKIHAPWNKLVSLDLVKKNEIKFEEVIKGNDALFSFLVGYYSTDNIFLEHNIIYICTYSTSSLTFGKQSIETCIQPIKARFYRNTFFEYIKKPQFQKSPIRDILRISKKLNLTQAIKAYWILILNFRSIYSDRYKYVKLLKKEKAL